MSDNLVEIRTSDGIVLVVDEDTISYGTRRLINAARDRQNREQENSGAAEEAGFEVVQHPVTREEQRAATLNIAKELDDDPVTFIFLLLIIIALVFYLLFW
ncbi:unnamed protein product [Caenorhabditis brenneri]